jgi:hypothetical protein
MDSITGYTLSDGKDLGQVFGSIQNSASLTNENILQATQKFANDIDLSGSLMFYSMPSTIVSGSIYPIGYTIDVSNGYTYAPGDGQNVLQINVYKGVWLLNVALRLTKTSGNYDNESRFRINLEPNINVILSPPAPLVRMPIEASNTVTPTLKTAITAVIVVKNNTSIDVITALAVSLATTITINCRVFVEITKLA